MHSIFEPFDRLSQLVGMFRPASKRFGKRQALYVLPEKFSFDIYPGGTHWQIVQSVHNKKPDWIADKNIQSLAQIEERIRSLKLWEWVTILALLQSSEKMVFSACKIQLRGITMAVSVAVVNTEEDYFYAVKREIYSPYKHGLNLPILTTEKDLMTFYYMSGMEKEDVPNPALIKEISSRPDYSKSQIPNLIRILGANLNSLSDDSEDRFWGGKKFSI